MNVKYEEIDKSRFAQLIREGREKGDFSSEELGKTVSYLCRIMLTADNYHRYTEDWMLDMMGNASLAAFKAMASTADLDNDVKLFNYIYTTIDNSFKRSIRRLNNQLVPENLLEGSEGVSCDELMPFYLRNKRRIVNGALKNNEAEVVRAASTMKAPLLKTVLERAARMFEETLNRLDVMKLDELDRLVSMARKNREALC